MAAAIEKLDEFGFEVGEMSPSVANVGQLALEERVDVAARCGAVLTDSDHACDLGERESCGLGAADESQPGERLVVVDAVPVVGALGFRGSPLRS